MTIMDKIKAYLPAAEVVANIALNIAKVMPISASVVNAIELGIKVANGVANEVPIAVQTWQDIQTAAAGGAKVSDDEWTAWQEQVDHAHVAFLAAAAKVESQA